MHRLSRAFPSQSGASRMWPARRPPGPVDAGAPGTQQWATAPAKERGIVSIAAPRPALAGPTTPDLTRRRAVDHCLVRSALCRAH